MTELLPTVKELKKDRMYQLRKTLLGLPKEDRLEVARLIDAGLTFYKAMKKKGFV